MKLTEATPLFMGLRMATLDPLTVAMEAPAASETKVTLFRGGSTGLAEMGRPPMAAEMTFEQIRRSASTWRGC